MAFDFNTNYLEQLRNRFTSFKESLPKRVEGAQQKLVARFKQFKDLQPKINYRQRVQSALPTLRQRWDIEQAQARAPKFRDLFQTLTDGRRSLGFPSVGSDMEAFSLPRLRSRFNEFIKIRVPGTPERGQALSRLSPVFDRLRSSLGQEIEQQQFETEQLGQPRVFGRLETPGSKWLRETDLGRKAAGFGIPINKPLSSFLTSDKPETRWLHPANLLIAPKEIRDIDAKLNARQPLTPEETKLASSYNTQDALGFALDIGAPVKIGAKPRALRKLSDLMNYEDTLRRKGFTVGDTANIGVNEGLEIIKEGLTPEQWRKGVKPSKFKGNIKQQFNNLFDPLKNAPKETQDILIKWRKEVLFGRAKANEAVAKFKHIPDEDGWSLIKYIERPTPENAQALGLNPNQYKKEITNLRVTFDDLRDKGLREGLEIGYIENYLNHVWKESYSEIAQRARSAGRRPSFTKQRSIPTYNEGLALGLTPRYTHPGALAAHYENSLHRALANKKMVDALKNSGELLPASQAPLDWLSIDAPLFPNASYTVRNRTVFENYKAPPELAQAVNNIFNYQSGGLMEGAANVSRLMQDVTLSGGIPKTPVNAFTIGNMIKDITAGRVRSPLTAFFRSFSDDASRNYFAKNNDYLKFMAQEGIPTYTNFDFTNAFKNVFESKTFKQKVGEVWQEYITDATFRRFMPQLHLNLFKDTFDKAIQNGMSPVTARKLAGDITKNFYGIADNFTRAKFVNDTLTASFFAPKFRGSMVNSWLNNVKSLIRKDPGLSLNRKFLGGTVLTYALYTALNKKLTGRYLHENKPGKEFFLEIPRPDDRSWFIPILPSIGTLPRRGAEIASNLLAGDIRSATQKFGTMLSQPINLTTQMATNRTFYGGPIYKDDDPAAIKVAKVAGYGLEQTLHPFLGEPFAVFQGRKTPLEMGMGMLELPVYPSASSYLYTKGLQGKMGAAQKRRFDAMVGSGTSKEEASDIISAERIRNKARLKEKAALTVTQKVSERNQAIFQLEALKERRETGEFKTTGSLEIDTILHAEEERQIRSDAMAVLKDPEVNEQQKREIITALGDTYEEVLIVALDNLSVVDKSAYVFIKVKSAPLGTKLDVAEQLAKDGILTTGVIDTWHEQGIISADEKKQWKNLIKLVKGTYKPSGKKAKQFKGRRLKSLVKYATPPQPTIPTPPALPRTPPVNLQVQQQPRLPQLSDRLPMAQPAETPIDFNIGASVPIRSQWAGR